MATKWGVVVAYVGRFKEYNVIPRHSGNPKVALVYPSTYRASITNLFTHIAYYFLLENTDALIDRFTLDNPSRGAVTDRRLKDFDLLLVSANYELDVAYIARLLSEAGVEIFTERRRGRPIVLVGGLAAMSNPEPFLEVADAVFVGEGEILLRRMVRHLTLLPDRPDDFVSSLGDGVYTGNSEVRKVYAEDINELAHPVVEIRSKIAEPIYGDGFYVEISRGCRWLCKFCLEGFVMYPYRYRSLDAVKKIVSEGLRYVPKRRVVMYALSIFDYPYIRELLTFLIDNEIDFSLPSIRWDTLRIEDLELISRSTQRSLALAPETLSPPLSCSIGKCFDPDRFTELAEAALGKGFDLKLYLMVGLPGEREEDVSVSARYVRALVSRATKLGRKVSVSLNPLVPKPHTPLQDYPLLDRSAYQRRVRTLERELGEGVVAHLSWSHAHLQALIAMGDRRVGRMAALLGVSGISYSNALELAEALGVDVTFPLRKRSKEERPWRNVIFPLDHVLDRLAGP